jgi:hypothetical protein
VKFAEKTRVPVDRSKNEIEHLVERYGADRFTSGWDKDFAVVQFEMRDRRVKFVLPLPPLEHYEQTKGGRARSPRFVRDAHQQGTRSRWRALALVIKAKLEAVESGVSTFEQEFGMVTVLPNGQTVGERIAGQIEESYRTQKMPPLLGVGS